MSKIAPARQYQCVVVRSCRVTARYHKLLVSHGALAARSRPGQFLSFKVSQGLDPLLRRPLSLHRVEKDRVEVLFEIVGAGTRSLSLVSAGDTLDVLGPLGNGFTLPARPQGVVFLVGGGMGVAPLVFLAQKLVEVHRSKELHVLLGAKTKKALLCAPEFRELGCKVHIATDDGSRGLKGRVSDLIAAILSTRDLRPSTIYACGPHPMLREIAKFAQARNIPCQVSLEAHMACGFGACLGCVIATTGGYKRVCKDGPVFEACDILWEQGLSRERIV